MEGPQPNETTEAAVHRDVVEVHRDVVEVQMDPERCREGAPLRILSNRRQHRGPSSRSRQVGSMSEVAGRGHDGRDQEVGEDVQRERQYRGPLSGSREIPSRSGDAPATMLSSAPI